MLTRCHAATRCIGTDAVPGREVRAAPTLAALWHCTRLQDAVCHDLHPPRKGHLLVAGALKGVLRAAWEQQTRLLRWALSCRRQQVLVRGILH